MLRVANRVLFNAGARSIIGRAFSYQERASKDFLKQVVSGSKPTRDTQEARHRSPKTTQSEGDVDTGKELQTSRTAERRLKSRKVDTEALAEPNSNATIEDLQPQSKEPKEISREQFINFEPIKIVSEVNRLIQTQYGVLRVPNTFKLKTLTNVYYLVNSTNINYVKTVLMNDSGALLLFPPVGVG